jgi:hypothetical protein
MTLPAFASPEDLGKRLPGVLDEERAQALLEDASAAVRSWAGRSWCNDDGTQVDWGDLAALHQDEIVRITISAAKRAYTNPANVQSTSTGPFSTSFSDSSPDVYLTAQEKAAVSRAVGSLGTRTGLGVISTTREDPVGSSDLGYVDERFGNVWVETDNGAPLPILDSDQIG